MKFVYKHVFYVMLSVLALGSGIIHEGYASQLGGDGERYIGLHQLPIKLTSTQLAEADVKAQCQLREKNQIRKIVVKDSLNPILPKILVNIIESYRSSCSDQWKTVRVISMLGSQAELNLCIDIPFRCSDPDGGLKLHYRDIFKVCCNASPYEWLNDVSDPDMNKKFQDFLSTIVTGVESVHFPWDWDVSNDFPLTIYWGNEVTPLTKKTLRSTKISDACHQILKEHGKLEAIGNPGTGFFYGIDLRGDQKIYFAIYCSNCNGQIHAFWSRLYHLLQVRNTPDESVFCSGKHVRCRMFRLRVVIAPTTQYSIVYK